MIEINYAEFQRRVDEGDVTLAECRRMGSTHRAYEWARTPPGKWNEEQKAAYYQGYDEGES